MASISRLGVATRTTLALSMVGAMTLLAVGCTHDFDQYLGEGGAGGTSNSATSTTNSTSIASNSSTQAVTTGATGSSTTNSSSSTGGGCPDPCVPQNPCFISECQGNQCVDTPIDGPAACSPPQNGHCGKFDHQCRTCGDNPDSVVNQCPDVCTSCEGNANSRRCIIDCEVENCAAVACPDGMNCEVQCGGLNSCNNTTVKCPTGHGCQVECTGLGACANAQLGCGDGTCRLDCDGQGSCANAEIECGFNECRLTCDGAGAQPNVVGCADSCNCRDECNN